MRIKINEQDTVTAIIYRANKKTRANITLLLGHGAGADQTSNFMVGFSEGLAARGVDVVTFNFLYTEQGRRAPDRNDKLELCYRAAIAAVKAESKLKQNRLMIGGKSMGGRIASQVAAGGVENLAGLVFLGTRCTRRANPISFAASIFLKSASRCFSFRARAIRSEPLTNCGQ